MNTQAVISAVSLLAAASCASAQDYSINWFTIDGGGGTSTRGYFSLSGTIGQHDAGGPMIGGDFSLTGGFWAGVGSTGSGCLPCPADYNQDGGIDGTDVEAFFADWEAAVGCSDTNQDGGIDGSDVDAFFAAWENGGC